MQYHRLLSYSRQETYGASRRNHFWENICLVLLYIFLAGFVIGGIDIMTRDVEPIYYFIAAIFVLGALFITVAIQVQRRQAINLRHKNLEIMKTFVNAIDLKDAYTKGHSQHLYRIMKVFYTHLPDDMRRSLNLPRLLDAAMLHDIGKISISDGILNKPGALTEAEWAVVRQHPQNGKLLLDDTCFADISDWVLYHHERIDGKGYYGLCADDVPTEAKMLAIADTYSALCTDRAYRERLDHTQAREIMLAVSGTQLDSRLLRYFFTIEKEELADLLD